MQWDDPDWSSDDSGPEDEYPRDQSIDAAKVAVEAFFRNNERRKIVYYVMQLQVIFERKFFHWITYKAVDELVSEEKLKDKIEALGTGTTVRFIFHPSCRSTTRQIKRKLNLIHRFSTEEVSRGCGRYAELLFSRGLMMVGFKFIAQNTREYQGRRWEESNRDLDYIFERDGYVLWMRD